MVNGALSWMNGSEWGWWGIILGGWVMLVGKYFGWVVVGRSEWGWLHCLIMTYQNYV